MKRNTILRGEESNPQFENRTDKKLERNPLNISGQTDRREAKSRTMYYLREEIVSYCLHNANFHTILFWLCHCESHFHIIHSIKIVD